MLASSSLQPSSIPTYKRAWRLFHQFLNAIFQTVSTDLPISPNTIALLSVICLISSMHLQPLAPMFRLKDTLINFFVLMIPLKPFLLSKCSKATIKRVLVPIAIFLSPSQSCTNYLIRRVIWLFIGIKFANSRPCVRQIFMLFLRVSEMTSTSSVGSPPPIQTGQLFKLADDSDNTIALKLVFANYKHSYNQRPFSIVKHRQPPFCPVQLLLDCLALRGNQPGPLFASLDTTSASRSFFTDIVRLALTSCGLNPSRYKGHSFRIKAPSFAADGGMSDVQIWPRLFKRWIVPSTG